MVFFALISAEHVQEPCPVWQEAKVTFCWLNTEQICGEVVHSALERFMMIDPRQWYRAGQVFAS